MLCVQGKLRLRFFLRFSNLFYYYYFWCCFIHIFFVTVITMASFGVDLLVCCTIIAIIQFVQKQLDEGQTVGFKHIYKYVEFIFKLFMCINTHMIFHFIYYQNNFSTVQWQMNHL